MVIITWLCSGIERKDLFIVLLEAYVWFHKINNEKLLYITFLCYT